MIEAFSTWVKNIVYIIIFIVFLEILLPNNSMRKYVKVVAGLLVMLVILTPITGLMNKNLDIQDLVSRNFIDIEQIDMKNKNVLLEGTQNDMTVKIYKEKLENQIKNQFEKNFEDMQAGIDVEILKESKNENFGSIKNIMLTLNQKQETEIKEDIHGKEGEVNKVEPIEKIEIGEFNEDEIEEEKEEALYITEDQEKEIKEFFLDFYNVLPENISINKQKNNMREEEQ